MGNREAFETQRYHRGNGLERELKTWEGNGNLIGFNHVLERAR